VSIRLAPGVEPQRAIAEIKQLVGDRASAVRATSRHPVDQRNDYVRWTADAEVHLTSVLDRRDAQAFFGSPRHRDICSMPPGNQLTTLIYAEVDALVRDLQNAQDYLEGHLRRMRAAPGVPVVVDSNVLLQCQRLDNVNWQAELMGEARVMVPLRVIEEIDAKKYGDSKRLRSIARELLPWVDGLFPTGEPGPVPLRGDATIELILAERPRYRPDDADEEVLEVAHDVLRFAGDVRLLTADTGMRIRARSEGLGVLFVPKQWRRPTGDEDQPVSPDSLR
jgi:rRNA-processing protein FCF1